MKTVRYIARGYRELSKMQKAIVRVDDALRKLLPNCSDEDRVTFVMEQFDYASLDKRFEKFIEHHASRVEDTPDASFELLDCEFATRGDIEYVKELSNAWEI